jgi:DsbC/DsbD-like thiol-disulfide interchange protein
MLAGLKVVRPVRLLVLVVAVALGGAVVLTGSPLSAQGKKSDAVVKVTLKADPEKPGADGQQVVTVNLAIDKGWHVYANPVGNKDLESSQTVVKVSAKNPPQVQMAYPEGKLIKDKDNGDYRTYEDKTAIKATVRRTAGDRGPLEVSITFQACDDKSCLLPATVKLVVP